MRIFRHENYRLKIGNEAPADEAQTRRSRAIRGSIINDIIKWFGSNEQIDLAQLGLKDDEYGLRPEMCSFYGSECVKNKADGDNNKKYECLKHRDMIAFYDGDNLSASERSDIYADLSAAGLDVLFLEVVCDTMTNEQIVKDFIHRIEPQYLRHSIEEEEARFIELLHESDKIYEPVSPSELNDSIQFLKYSNWGSDLTLNNVGSFVAIRIFEFLMCLIPTPRFFYVCRHGESKFNIEGKIGGNPELSDSGVAFSKELSGAVGRLAESQKKRLVVWTSTLIRARQTAEPFNAKKVIWRFLDELDSGVFECYTYDAIRSSFREEYLLRAKDKFCYRYNCGESYRDLFHRVLPVLLELESNSRSDIFLLIIGHQAVLRIVYAYFSDVPIHLIPFIDIPLHNLIKFETDSAYSYKIENHIVDSNNIPSRSKRESSLNPTSDPDNFQA